MHEEALFGAFFSVYIDYMPCLLYSIHNNNAQPWLRAGGGSGHVVYIAILLTQEAHCVTTTTAVSKANENIDSPVSPSGLHPCTTQSKASLLLLLLLLCDTIPSMALCILSHGDIAKHNLFLAMHVKSLIGK